MIKKTVTYTDYNDDRVTETFHFHISKSDLLDNIDIREEFEDLAGRLEGDKRELTDEETMSVLKLIKRLIRLAYGVRYDDGKKFRKSDEDYADLYNSAAYDELLFALFEDPNEATEFMTGLLPKDLMEKAAEQARKQPTDFKRKEIKSGQSEVVPFQEDSDDESEPEDKASRAERLRKELEELEKD